VAKRKIRAKELISDIRSGVDVSGLEAKYQLTSKQLAGLLGRLEDKGLLDPNEVHALLEPRRKEFQIQRESGAGRGPEAGKESAGPAPPVQPDKKRQGEADEHADASQTPVDALASEAIQDLGERRGRGWQIASRVGSVLGQKYRWAYLTVTALLFVVSVFLPDFFEDVNASLFAAVGAGDAKEVARLLNKGADVNCRNPWTMTPLMLASMEGHRAVAEVLIKKGADLNTRDRQGYTALDWASMSRQKSVRELLLSHGATQ
jgi:hypothetical protein